ncbi:MAG TPA: VCBS repeat-containing protein, partial [Blastocatellia bacterium]
MKRDDSVTNPLTRRGFLKSATGAAFAGSLLGRWPFRTIGRAGIPPSGQDGESALFEEVPSVLSGLKWVHENAMSPERYLPEAIGPGCAFLDYDNDGWMDIYFVNSGACDFYKPAKPIRNALYKNNRDGTFTDVTERAGVAG